MKREHSLGGTAPLDAMESFPAEELDGSGTIHAEKPIRPIPLPPPQELIY